LLEGIYNNNMQVPTEAGHGPITGELIVMTHKAYRFEGEAYFRPKTATKWIAIAIQTGGPWVDLDDSELIDAERSEFGASMSGSEQIRNGKSSCV